jgi:hypothetical protein
MVNKRFSLFFRLLKWICDFFASVDGRDQDEQGASRNNQTKRP